MATVKLPLMSFSARGCVGPLNFGQVGAHNSCRGIVRKTARIQTARRTTAQARCRDQFSAASAAWRALDVPTRALWIGVGRGHQYQPRTLFLAEYIRQNVQPPALPLVPDLIWV